MMWKLFERTGRLAITFCERCSQVCGAGCRRAALREQAVLQRLRLGVRV